MSEPRLFVHALLNRFREVCRGLEFDDLIALNARLDSILARHGSGWRKPSADEAVLEGRPPWLQPEAPGTPLDWGASLRDAISRELHLDASVGIAATEVAARICARLAQPRGVLVWMPGHERGLIGGMPLDELEELRPEQLARLRSEGIATLDALAELEPSEARALLGFEGERLVELVRGSDSRVDRPGGSRIPGALALLAKRLSRRLDRERLQARGLELTIDFADGVTRERHAHLHRPTSDPEELAEAAFRLYRPQPRTAPMARLSLTATGLTSAEQLDLFGSPGSREVRVELGRADGPDLRIDSAGGERLCSPHTGG